MKKLRMSPNEVITSATNAINLAKKFTDDVEFSQKMQVDLNSISFARL